MLSYKKTWFTEAALQNVNSQVNKCKILVNYICSRGKGSITCILAALNFHL